MRADVLTTWGAVLELDGTFDEDGPDPAGRCFALGRKAFLAQCPRLAALLRAEGAGLRVTAEQVGRLAAAGGASTLRVGVSVVEVRPTSFDMAVRVRPGGDGAGPPVNGRCTIVIERQATGERILLPREVREELIAVQLAAKDLC